MPSSLTFVPNNIRRVSILVIVITTNIYIYVCMYVESSFHSSISDCITWLGGEWAQLRLLMLWSMIITR